MTILVTGGTGKTGSILSRLLKEANQSVLIASRGGIAPHPYKAVKFDWFDDKTFENPFKADSNIDRVYLVLPVVFDRLDVVKPFVDVAISKGVKRFVLLGATGPNRTMEKLDKYLSDIKVEYTVLRPTWFQQNFGTLFYHSIREQNEIFSVAKDGRIPFISAEDIAQAAYDALVSQKRPNKDYFIVGPELFSYDEVAELFTEILGRKITYRRISIDESKQNFIECGIPPEYAECLAKGESEIATSGTEEEAFNAEGNKKIVGKHTVREYIEANRDIWIKQYLR